MRDRSAVPVRRRRLIGVTAMTAAVVVAVPLGQSAIAASGGSATAGTAAVDINSNVEPIDLNLQGESPLVVAPPEIGTDTDTSDVAFEYLDSSLIVDVDETEAFRYDGGLSADSNTNSTSLTLLGELMFTAGQIGSSVLCPTEIEPAGGGIAEAADVDLGGGPVSLAAGESTSYSFSFESPYFDPNSASADLHAETIVAQGDDGENDATGLLVEVSINGTPLGVGDGPFPGIITGSVIIAASFCSPDGLANTGPASTGILLLAGVMLLAAGSSALVWTRRR